MQKQKLIILIGLPASGKTKYAQEYSKTHPNTVIVSTDRVREDKEALGLDIKDERTIYEEMQHRVRKSLKFGKNVIVNATNLKVRYRQPYIYLAKKFNPDLEIEAHVILADIDECAEADKIKKRLGLDFLRKCMGEFQLPLESEGFNKIEYHFVSTKAISQEKEMPVVFFSALMTKGYFNGMNAYNVGQAISIIAEKQGYDKDVQIASFFALLGKSLTNMQEFGQLAAYFILCHLFARPQVVKKQEELDRWLKVCMLINYFSLYANWGKRWNKIFNKQERKELKAIYDNIHSVKSEDEAVRIIQDYYKGALLDGTKAR